MSMGVYAHVELDTIRKYEQPQNPLEAEKTRKAFNLSGIKCNIEYPAPFKGAGYLALFSIAFISLPVVQNKI